MTTTGFAIIDFETTGLFHGGHDRVIEVALADLLLEQAETHLAPR